MKRFHLKSYKSDVRLRTINGFANVQYALGTEMFGLSISILLKGRIETTYQKD